MKKNFMEELKKDYNAWLVVRVEDAQDWNSITLIKYLVFVDEVVLEVEENNKVKEATNLFYYYPKLKEVLEKLDSERKRRFEMILTEVEKEWKEYAELTKPKSFKVV